MSHKKLAEIVVRSIEYLELADDAEVDGYAAINILESISADLAEATPEEQAAVKQAARDRLAWFLQVPDEYGYSPRKTFRPKHRRLLEGIAWGEMFGQAESAT